MTDKISDLVIKIDDYLNGKLTSEVLGQYTLAIISNDEFDTLPANIQEAIYVLDNKELNELTYEQVGKVKKELLAL